MSSARRRAKANARTEQARALWPWLYCRGCARFLPRHYAGCSGFTPEERHVDRLRAAGVVGERHTLNGPVEHTRDGVNWYAADRYALTAADRMRAGYLDQTPAELIRRIGNGT